MTSTEASQTKHLLISSHIELYFTDSMWNLVWKTFWALLAVIGCQIQKKNRIDKYFDTKCIIIHFSQGCTRVPDQTHMSIFRCIKVLFNSIKIKTSF